MHILYENRDETFCVLLSQFAIDFFLSSPAMHYLFIFLFVWNWYYFKWKKTRPSVYNHILYCRSNCNTRLYTNIDIRIYCSHSNIFCPILTFLIPATYQYLFCFIEMLNKHLTIVFYCWLLIQWFIQHISRTIHVALKIQEFTNCFSLVFRFSLMALPHFQHTIRFLLSAPNFIIHYSNILNMSVECDSYPT